MPQERRSYSKSFKAQVIAECAQPDTSIAHVALIHNLNANLVHKCFGWASRLAKYLAISSGFRPHGFLCFAFKKREEGVIQPVS